MEVAADLLYDLVIQAGLPCIIRPAHAVCATGDDYVIAPGTSDEKIRHIVRTACAFFFGSNATLNFVLNKLKAEATRP